MSRTKRYYAERVVIGLQNGHPNIDFKIHELDIFASIDAIVNAQAKAGFLNNWKMGTPGLSETFITTWDGEDAIEVIDQTNGKFSYMELPVQHWIDLPLEQGIVEIWPQKWQPEGKNFSVVIMTHSDVRLYANNMAGGMQGRLAGYPQGNRFWFTSCDVKKRYGNMGLRLAVRDSQQIDLDAVYPIPGDQEEFIIRKSIEYFVQKKLMAPDKVRDKNDQA